MAGIMQSFEGIEMEAYIRRRVPHHIVYRNRQLSQRLRRSDDIAGGVVDGKGRQMRIGGQLHGLGSGSADDVQLVRALDQRKNLLLVRQIRLENGESRVGVG